MQPISFRLDGKVAVVTGAGRGIGQTLALGLAQAGADVVLLSRTIDEVEANAREIAAQTGRKTLALHCDVSDPASIEQAVQTAYEEFGHLDILINNAGTSVRNTALEMKVEEWDEVMNTNFRSIFLMSQAVAHHMVKQKWGRIVNMASVASAVTVSFSAAYGPSKAGVVHLTRQMATEWAKDGVTVNAISPWYVKTTLNEKYLENDDYNRFMVGRTPIGRLAQPEDLVASVIFFCSEGAAYVTGQNLFIDGGSTHFCV